MDDRREHRGPASWTWGRTRRGVRERVASILPPGKRWPLVRLPWSRVVTWLMLLVGLAVQLVIIEAVFELVDLSISLMELWTELARKHLEITL